MNLRRFCAALMVVFSLVEGLAAARAVDLYLAEGRAGPGRILMARDARVDSWFARRERVVDGAVPRVQSLTVLPSGRVVFVSGLDRMIVEITPRGERVLTQGGYLARQVRTATAGALYWSGLETPRDGAPLPDGFIYAWDAEHAAARTVMTFSQGDVGRDWWGAFDVRDGMIYVGTLASPTRIYDFATPLPRLVATLPISATAFRFAADGSLWACDGRGSLYRFPDLAHPETSEVVLRSETAFVDFAFAAGAAR